MNTRKRAELLVEEIRKAGMLRQDLTVAGALALVSKVELVITAAKDAGSWAVEEELRRDAMHRCDAGTDCRNGMNLRGLWIHEDAALRRDGKWYCDRACAGIEVANG